jgi:tRNA delta(2)-isopentenylpyrophosphate transferase
LGIKIDRERTDMLIKSRIKKMIDFGWIEEVNQLLKNGIKKSSPAMSSIGYKEVVSYIEGEYDKNQLEEKIFISTRKLMRHQDNWFKKSDKRIKWIDFDNSFDLADNIISEWLSKN